MSHLLATSGMHEMNRYQLRTTTDQPLTHADITDFKR